MTQLSTSALAVRIGKRIRYLRRDADLTQAELAKMLGITQSAMAHIERGDGIGIETLYAIEEILGDVWGTK